MEALNIDFILNICGFSILAGMGLGLVGLRRLGWFLAIIGFLVPGLIMMKVELGAGASFLFDRWWSEQPEASKMYLKLAGWATTILFATLVVFGIFRLIASLFIGRNAADALVANLAADSIRGLFRWAFWWRR